MPLQQYLPFTVLKHIIQGGLTNVFFTVGCNSTYRLRYWNIFFGFGDRRNTRKLQQHLPFTVLKLKRSYLLFTPWCLIRLQQHLPFTVLKLAWLSIIWKQHCHVATALTVYGIETSETFYCRKELRLGCNSTYRLRYWNVMLLKLDVNFWVATALTVYGIETIITCQC